MALPSVRLLTTAVQDLLAAAPAGLTRYTTLVDPAPPVDDAGVVTAYAVLHPYAGNDTANNLAVNPGQILWGFQIDCGGGDATYLLWAVDTVRGLLSGQTLTVAGAKVGRLQPPLGYNPPTRPELNVTPPRITVPLQYQVLAVSSS